MNSSIHQATQHSPFYTVYLREPKLPIDAAFAPVRDQPVEAVEKLVTRHATVTAAVRRHIDAANRYAAAYANRRRRDVEFSPGDLVMLSTQHLPLPPPLTRKLAPRWLGPLPVLARVGAVAYRLQLPPSLTRLHAVFHISLLKKYEGDVAPAPREPIFAVGDDEEFEVERILNHRSSRRGTQYLIQWKGYPLFEATWEPEANLGNSPDLLSSYKSQHGLE